MTTGSKEQPLAKRPGTSAPIRSATAIATAIHLAMTALAALLALSGCGGVYYSVNVSAAQAKIEQAREMGAETAAPYEYYYAKEHLRQAQVEAASAAYGDAASYAETAETYAQKAIDLIQAARRSESK